MCGFLCFAPCPLLGIHGLVQRLLLLSFLDDLVCVERLVLVGDASRVLVQLSLFLRSVFFDLVKFILVMLGLLDLGSHVHDARVLVALVLRLPDNER